MKTSPVATNRLCIITMDLPVVLDISMMVSMFANGPGDLGSIPG